MLPSLPIVQTPLLVQDSVLAFIVSPKVKRRLSDAPLHDNCKGKQAAEGPSKRHKKKGEMSSAFHLSLVEQAVLRKPKFLIAKLGKEVTMANTAMDHDTSLALGECFRRDLRFVGDATNSGLNVSSIISVTPSCFLSIQ